ncbi:AAA family ATPase [Candidatus Gottesmanbacteria bacterium]|nr:AAA family ATPase [Candidatus Gottesmanbacteria bacterium]
MDSPAAIEALTVTPPPSPEAVAVRPFSVRVQESNTWYDTFSQAQKGELPRRGFTVGKISLNDEVASELSCIAKITGGEKDPKVAYMLAGQMGYSDARLQKDKGFNTTGEVVKVARLLREKGIGVKFDTSASGTQIMILKKDDLQYRVDLGWSSPKEKPEQKLDPSMNLYEKSMGTWRVRKGEHDNMPSEEPRSENDPIYFELVDDKKLPMMEAVKPEDLAKRVTGFADVLGDFIGAYYHIRNGTPSADTLDLQIPDWETYVGDDKNLATVGEWKPSDTFSGIFGRSKWKTEEDIGYLLTEAEKAAMPSFADIGGQPRAVEEARRLVMSIKHADVFAKRGVDRPKGILLKGPPGTGKTLLAKAIAREANTEFLSLSVTDLVSKWFGEAEQKVQGFFDRAKAIADQGKDVIAFIDEIDSVVPPQRRST